GGAPVLIPLLADDEHALREVYNALDGVLMPGGVDMDPGLFGEERHAKLGRVDEVRDRVEMQLTRWSIADRKPLLGLCRGLQVLNVTLGGTLYQDLEAQFPAAIKHDYFPTYGFERDHLAHDVALSRGTRLAALLERDRITVNSMHHQGIKALAPGLVVSAVAPDGLIEAAELPGAPFCVGVQWHPEVFEMVHPDTRRVFHEFVAAAALYRGA
ncbi:MAG: gamma-glutamyl-gamma-aminobutyrate hydrolase family protein, partial [Gemmatimonadaceae bacterium]